MGERKELLALLNRAKRFLGDFFQFDLFGKKKDFSDLKIIEYAENLVSSIEKKIRFYDFYYYEKNDSLVSDSDYDELKFFLGKILDKFPRLKKSSSAFSRVGSLTLSHFQKIKHKNKILSLSNAFDQFEIEDWYNRVQKSLSSDNNLFSDIFVNVEPKIDGISISFHYVNGKFHRAVTRGDGNFGEDVTNNVKNISGLPLEIPSNDNFLDVRGEIYLTKKNFSLLENNYSTLRNTASGLIRQKNPENIDKLDFFVYGAILESYEIYKNHSEIILHLRNLGFNVIPQLGLFSDINCIFKVYEDVKDNRYKLEYDIDGLVLKIDSIKYQDLIGCDSRVPKWAIAYKFPPSEVKSKLIGIQVQVGRLGTLTPVAILEPVNIGGVFINRATLHNEDYIKDNDIRINDIVLIERAGDIIPQVVKSFSEERDLSKEYEFWEPLKNCPSCNSPAIRENAYRRCTNFSSCPEINIGLLKHFVSKYAFDIQGLGDKTIRSFYEQGILKIPSDIFDLKNKIKSKKDLEHFCKLLVFIEKKKSISLGRFIYSLGIQNIGKVLANSIANLYHSSNIAEEWLLDMINLDNSKVINLDGVGGIIFDSLKNYFSNDNNLNEIKKLLRILNIDSERYSDNKNISDRILKDEVVVFTGSLKTMSRSEASEIVQKLGGRISNSINKNVTLVVFGDNAGSKLDKAKKLNIKMLSDDEWISLISKF